MAPNYTLSGLVHFRNDEARLAKMFEAFPIDGVMDVAWVPSIAVGGYLSAADQMVGLTGHRRQLGQLGPANADTTLHSTALPVRTGEGVRIIRHQPMRPSAYRVLPVRQDAVPNHGPVTSALRGLRHSILKCILPAGLAGAGGLSLQLHDGRLPHNPAPHGMTCFSQDLPLPILHGELDRGSGGQGHRWEFYARRRR